MRKATHYPHEIYIYSIQILLHILTLKYKIQDYPPFAAEIIDSISEKNELSVTPIWIKECGEIEWTISLQFR